MSMTKNHRKGGESMSIAITFAQARIKVGLSQTEVARRLGIDQSTDELFGRGQDSA